MGSDCRGGTLPTDGGVGRGSSVGMEPMHFKAKESSPQRDASYLNVCHTRGWPSEHRQGSRDG